MHIKHSHLILDACCILNFSASGNLISIIKSIPAQVVITEVVRKQELKSLQSLENEENEGAIQLENAIQQGLLLVIDFESEAEEETFVNYVFELGDDGESSTFAIAFHREWAVATDDKCAMTFFQKSVPDCQLLSTLEIIKYWSEDIKLDSTSLKTALNSIKVKGRYLPNKRHHLYSWWESAMI
jgi:predicted nucleic acid-binding protein